MDPLDSLSCLSSGLEGCAGNVSIVCWSIVKSGLVVRIVQVPLSNFIVDIDMLKIINKINTFSFFYFRWLNANTCVAG